jgi:hypothetical protein
VTVSFGVYAEFYAPVAVIIHLWFGLGVSAILLGVARFFKRVDVKGRIPAHLVPTLLGVAFAALILIQAKDNLSLAIQDGTTTFIREEKIYPYFMPDRYLRLSGRILNKVEDDAIIFDIWDRIYTHIYTAHILEGRTGIVFHEVFPNLGETALAYIDENIDKRPIYFATFYPEIENYYDLEQIDDGLYRLKRK